MPVPSVPRETVNVVYEICGLIMSLLELIYPAEVSIPDQVCRNKIHRNTIIISPILFRTKN
jgi:hypothetical protein